LSIGSGSDNTNFVIKKLKNSTNNVSNTQGLKRESTQQPPQQSLNQDIKSDMLNEVGPLSITKSVLTAKSRHTRNLSGGNLSSEGKDELFTDEMKAVNTLLMEGDQVDEMLIAEYNAKMQRQRLMTQQSWNRQYNNGSHAAFAKKAVGASPNSRNH
jgi:hypothetical protein